MSKQELDHRVSMELGIKKEKVAEVTDAFVSELCNAIAHHGGFQLPGLGKLVSKIELGGSAQITRDGKEATRVRLYFTKSRLLREQINRQFGIKESSHAEE